jgi:hypothetical protein
VPVVILIDTSPLLDCLACDGPMGEMDAARLCTRGLHIFSLCLCVTGEMDAARVCAALFFLEAAARTSTILLVGASCLLAHQYQHIILAMVHD